MALIASDCAPSDIEPAINYPSKVEPERQPPPAAADKPGNVPDATDPAASAQPAAAAAAATDDPAAAATTATTAVAATQGARARTPQQASPRARSVPEGLTAFMHSS